MRALASLFCLTVVVGCGLLGPHEDFWCSQTYYFTITDSLVALPDSVVWGLQPDSVATTWAQGGECPRDRR